MPRSYALSDEARAGRQAQKQATRDALLQAAQALFVKKGFDNTSVTEIGKAAGVSHTLINTYFGGKAGLLAAVVQTTNAPQLLATQELAKGEADPVAQLRSMLLAWATHDLADRRLIAVLHATSWSWDAQSEATNRAERDAFFAILADVIARARRSGLAQGHVAPADVAEAIFAIYTWGIRQALFLAIAPDAAIARIWPQIQAAAGLPPEA